MALISVTRLRIRSWLYVPLFLLHATRSGRQAAQAEGNIATRVLQYGKRTYWTATAWTNAEAMKAYMLTGAHRKAMPKLLDWCDEASVVHWTSEDANIPGWPDCAARMQAEGRPSKVRHPSEAHTAFRIPVPPAKPAGEFRFR